MPNAFATHYSDKVDQRCRLCGSPGPLTFEHVPPKRCFNHAPLVLRTIRGMVKQFQSPEKFRRGLGTKSLCERCNGWTATQYGRAFAEFSTTAMETLDRLTLNDKAAFVPFTCSALRVGKQLAVMALALTATYTLKSDAFNRLRALVLDPEARGLPRGLQFWAYFMKDGNPRLTSMGIPFHSGGLLPMVWCEIALPPLGYVVTGDRQDDLRIAHRFKLCNLSWLFERPDKRIDTVYLLLPILRPIGGASLQYEGHGDEYLF